MNRLSANRSRLGALIAVLCLLHLAGLLVPPSSAQDAGQAVRGTVPFVFRDTGEETGLLPLVRGIRGHGAAWGDANGDGRIDLYVGTFHTDGPPNLLLWNKGDGFHRDDQSALQISSRATGVVFADLDNDGDLDLYVGSMPAPEGSRLAERTGRVLAGCTLFRNDGDGKFTNISEGNGACPESFGGRSVAVLDFDGDGLLDLLVGEDPLPGYNGSSTRSSRLFRNLGNLQFQDVSRKAGLPDGIPGLGVAVADVNNDGWPDFFLASSGGNRLFLNNGNGTFREAPGSREVFAWPTAGGDDMVCGVVFGDVNRDGLLDVVIGQHYKHPWTDPLANRLYLNRGIRDGVPIFEDATEQVGLVPLPMKAPHVEIQDFDNDGWPDIFTSIVKFADGRPHPVIFRHLGLRNGVPQFRADALDVNPFPTPEDQAIRRSGALFDKLIRERTIIYTAPGPSGDYDNDGRLDLFLASWWPEFPSLLLRNETPGGGWLDVCVEGTNTVNRQGIGSRINIYSAGKLGDPTALLGCREISVGYGYASGQPAVAHFGLGETERVDVEVILPHNVGGLIRTNVRANQRITLTEVE
jgi:enediyne biosynthesis protein E4